MFLCLLCSVLFLWHFAFGLDWQSNASLHQNLCWLLFFLVWIPAKQTLNSPAQMHEQCVLDSNLRAQRVRVLPKVISPAQSSSPLEPSQLCVGGEQGCSLSRVAPISGKFFYWAKGCFCHWLLLLKPWQEWWNPSLMPQCKYSQTGNVCYERTPLFLQ